MADMGNAEPSMPAVVVADEGLTESMTPVRVDDGPSPKARGPAPPRPENPVIENLEGNTVHGVLLGSEDLESVLLDIQMSRAEGGEQLMRTLSYEVSKSEAERRKLCVGGPSQASERCGVGARV